MSITSFINSMVVAFVFGLHSFYHINQFFASMMMAVVVLTFCFLIGNVSITDSGARYSMYDDVSTELIYRHLITCTYFLFLKLFILFICRSAR